MKRSKVAIFVVLIVLCMGMLSMTVSATNATPAPTPSGGNGSGNVSKATEDTWKDAKGQVKTVVNNVVFPVVDLILAVLFFVKLGTAYFDYRKHGQFEFTAPAILFACLIFTLTAPLYIWSILP